MAVSFVDNCIYLIGIYTHDWFYHQNLPESICQYLLMPKKQIKSNLFPLCLWKLFQEQLNCVSIKKKNGLTNFKLRNHWIVELEGTLKSTKQWTSFTGKARMLWGFPKASWLILELRWTQPQTASGRGGHYQLTEENKGLHCSFNNLL